jgi:DNA (cytosine-5)-methyltransferase 1
VVSFPEKWRRLHPEQPAYTILAQMHRDLSEWVHPKFERWITVREAARLQSFHDGFEFKSSEWQMLKQIGNAVPPLLARALAAAIERALLRLDRKEIQALRHPERLILRDQAESALLP